MKNPLCRAAGAAFAVSLAFLFSSCSSSRTSLPAVVLESLSGGNVASLASCPTPKCFTVYVAPWCPYCHASTPSILSLRTFLKDHGITTRVIVGMDKPESVRQYAETFGPGTLLDPSGKFDIAGVPHFFVSNNTGRILKEVEGFPVGTGGNQELAGYFGLP